MHQIFIMKNKLFVIKYSNRKSLSIIWNCNCLLDIQSLEKRILNLEKRVADLEEQKDKTDHNHAKKYDDITIPIMDLKKESFFDNPRKLKEIIKQLKTNASFSSLTECKESLEILVRNKELRRKQIEHQWAYMKY